MRKVLFAEKDKVIDIISNTFENNPGVNWLIRKGGSRKKRFADWPAMHFSNHLTICIFGFGCVAGRYGFETFHYWEDPVASIKFWFMKWEPSMES